MPHFFSSLLLTSLVGAAACSPSDPVATKTAARPVVPAAAPAVAVPVQRDTLFPAAAMTARAAAITSSYADWYSYAYYRVPLDRPFVGLGASERPLTKQNFLRQLATGRYIALRRGTKASRPVYQLYSFVSTPVEAARIRNVMQHLAQAELINYAQQGRPLPSFKLTDLAGTAYTPASFQGKVLVLKCWFISCEPCVREFPKVNALASRYQNNPDVRFVSLAIDNAAKLRPFLASHPLRYATVPGMEGFMQRQLRVKGYPAHIVVGRDGRISYFAYSPTYLVAAIDEALSQPAPPPAR